MKKAQQKNEKLVTQHQPDGHSIICPKIFYK